MKFLALITFLFFSSSLASGQSPTLKVGAPYPVIDAKHKFYFQTEKNIVTVKITNELIYVSIIDKASLRQTFTTSYPAPHRVSEMEAIAELGNKIFVFYSKYDAPRKKEILISTSIDMANGKLIDKQKVIFETTKELWVYYYPVRNLSNSKSKYSFRTSFDQSKLLITYRLQPPAIKKFYDQYGLITFNDDLALVSSTEITLPYLSLNKLYSISDFTIDVDGNSYFVYEGERSTSETDAASNVHLEIMKVAAKTNKVETIPIALRDKFINDIWIYEFDENKIACTGFYSGEDNSSSVNGILVFNVERDNKITNFVNHDIPINVLNQFVKGRTKNKNNRNEEEGTAELENLAFRGLQFDKDGSYLITGEQQVTWVKDFYTKAKGGGAANIASTEFYDILACKIKPDGTLGWMRKLPKKQEGLGANIGDLSFATIASDDTQYFVYVDSEDNLNLKETDTPKLHKNGNNGFLAAYNVKNETGEVKKIGIGSLRDFDGKALYQFGIHRIVQTSEKEFIFEAYLKGNEDAMVRVIFR